MFPGGGTLKKQSNVVRTLLTILILLTIIIGVTYAFFNVNFLGIRKYSVEVSGLVFRYKEKEQGITLDNPEFITDEEGKVQDMYFDFEVYAEKEEVPYLLYIKENEESTVSPLGVKMYLTDQEDNEIESPKVIGTLPRYNNESKSHIIHTDIITPDPTTNNATHKYRLRVWLIEDINAVTYITEGDSQTGIVGGTYSFKVNVATYNKSGILSATTENKNNQVTFYLELEEETSSYAITTSNIEPEEWIELTTNKITTESYPYNKYYYIWTRNKSGVLSEPYLLTMEENIPSYTVTYTGITNNGYPTSVMENDSINIQFKGDIPNRINVYVGGTELDRDTYTYQNGLLQVRNITGNVVIEKGESVLIAGQPFSANLKNFVAGTTDATYKSVDTSVKYIGFYEEEIPAGYTESSFFALPSISVSDDGKVRAYNDNGKVYVYSKNDILANESMYSMFRGFQSLTDINLLALDTSNTTSMQSLFNASTKLSTIDLTNLDTSNVTDMVSMFNGCTNLTNLDLSGFDTSNVTNMADMFQSCKSLTSLDLSSFNTSKVTSMFQMFYICSSLTTLDLSTFSTNNVKNMMQMFGACTSLTTLDLSAWNTEYVTNMSLMFRNAPSLKTIYVGSEWTVSNVTSSADMFTYSTNLVGGAGTTYNSSYIDKTYARIDGGTSSPGYFTQK